jgi:proton glutamate symport protein
MVIGVAFGGMFPEQSQGVKILSNIFLRLIKSIIVPILFSALVVGIAGHSDNLKAIGRLALKSIIYFEIVTTIALGIGLIAVNITQPGVGISLKTAAPAANIVQAQKMTWQETIEHIIPKSLIEAAAANDVLQVVFFALLFSVAVTMIAEKHRILIISFFEAVLEAMFKFTGIVMKFAPIGIGAAMAVTVGHSGLTVLINLGKLVLTLYGALIVFCVAVLFPIMLIARIPLKKFFKAVKEPALIAFSTTSSDAALPDALKRMIEFGVPKRIVSFVLPTGYSFNLDGTTLYLAVGSLFVTQAAGIHLTLSQQLLMMLTLMLTSKGVAAVPRAGLVVLSGSLVSFGLPLEGVAIILGVDELLDMARTSVNLIGNCLASAVMARWEGELNIQGEIPE